MHKPIDLEFCDFVEESEPADPLMPLMHTTDLFKFRTIIKTKSLSPRPCKFFEGEDLLYLFYGRPSFRPNQNVGSTSLRSYKPVCLILDEKLKVSPCRVFPFDSGAYKSGFFSKHMHEDMDELSFSLKPFVGAAAKLVSSFFGDNSNYYRGEAKNNLTIPNFLFEGHSYHSLISDKSATDYDDRRSAIEIQIDHKIKLNKSSVKAAIMPQDFCDEDAIRKTILKTWNASLIGYPSYHSDPKHDVGAIYEITRKFLSEDGIM